jgi:hypothetical protein
MEPPITNLQPTSKDSKEASPAGRDVLPSRLIGLLIVAVLTWGVIHALGAYLFNYNAWRAIVVLACVMAFLGSWGLLLWNRARRAD